MELGISGKRALVLASSQGLGLGIATKLCEEGAHVLISGRGEDKLSKAAATPGVVQPIHNLAMSNTIRSSLVGWSKSLSNEVAAAGISVNMLLPGKISTQRLKTLDENTAKATGKSVEEVSAAEQAAIPAGRYGTVEEFGSVAAFLLSEPARYMTGGLIRCDGGLIRGI